MVCAASSVSGTDTVYKTPREVILAYNSKKRVGNYLIGKTIGEGAFAKVKEGLHVITGEKVAIKIIDKTKAKQDSYLWRNLKREVKLLQTMRHPNVVELYESLETEVAYYLVLELIRGGEMKDHISKADKLTERQTKKYMQQLLSAVWHIHSAGVVHRDLKVENIMLSRGGDLKIIDFGLSNSLRSLDAKNGRGTQCGSPAYAAPELLANKGYDSRVDIWAIGVNMFAMLVGKLPFKVKPFNLKKLYQKMVTGDMEPLPSGTSQEATDLIGRLLNPDPEERITLQECAGHPWLATEHLSTLNTFSSCPVLVSENLNREVITYMSECQNVDGDTLEVDLLSHNITSHTATYHHLCNRLRRHTPDSSPPPSTLPVTTDKIQLNNRRSSKPRVIKKRPKTAGNTAKQSEVTQNKVQRRNSAGNIARKTESSIAKKEAFRDNVLVRREVKLSVSEGVCNPDTTSNEPARHTREVTSGSRRAPTDMLDGKIRWRQSPLLHKRTLARHLERSLSEKGCPVFGGKVEKGLSERPNNTTRQGAAHVRDPGAAQLPHPAQRSIRQGYVESVYGSVGSSKETLYKLGTGIQWPLLGTPRPDRARARQPVSLLGQQDRVTTSLLGNQDKVTTSRNTSYRWRRELDRARAGLNPNNQLLTKYISLPEAVGKQPQYRTFNYR